MGGSISSSIHQCFVACWAISILPYFYIHLPKPNVSCDKCSRTWQVASTAYSGGWQVTFIFSHSVGFGLL